MIIAMIVARPLLGNFDQAFQYIQEFTGFFTPGVVGLFLLAFFWRKATAEGALAAAISAAAISLAFKLLWPELPFLDRVGIAFVACVLIGMLVSKIQGAGDHPDAIDYHEVDTTTSSGFNIASAVIILILTALYTIWW